MCFIIFSKSKRTFITLKNENVSTYIVSAIYFSGRIEGLICKINQVKFKKIVSLTFKNILTNSFFR